MKLDIFQRCDKRQLVFFALPLQIVIQRNVAAVKVADLRALFTDNKNNLGYTGFQTILHDIIHQWPVAYR